MQSDLAAAAVVIRAGCNCSVQKSSRGAETGSPYADHRSGPGRIRKLVDRTVLIEHRHGPAGIGEDGEVRVNHRDAKIRKRLRVVHYLHYGDSVFDTADGRRNLRIDLRSRNIQQRDGCAVDQDLGSAE